MSDPPAVLLFLAAAALMFFIALLLATKSFSAIWSTHCVLETDFWSSYFPKPSQLSHGAGALRPNISW